MSHLKGIETSLQKRYDGVTMPRMSSGRIFRFGPNGCGPNGNDRATGETVRRPSRLFIFLHGCGATAQSMIPIAFRFQGRFPSAALVVPSGFNPGARGGAAQDWYPTRGLNCDNHRERVARVLPDVEDLVRREQTNFAVPASRTVLIGFSQGGTMALEAGEKPGLPAAGGGRCAGYVLFPARGARIGSPIHLAPGEFHPLGSPVYPQLRAP